MTRFAAERRVVFVEEPSFEEGREARLEVTHHASGVVVVVPHVPAGRGDAALAIIQRALLDRFLRAERLDEFLLWYYTPMALSYTRHLAAVATVYDCMDELSAFAGAPPALRTLEAELMARADVVFTGGVSLYEAKRALHRNVHAFPSSVDVSHFARARRDTLDPADQRAIARPRLGFFGVIDERMDLALLAGVAAARPEWQIVLLGPVAKIDPASLPRAANLHYLGSKSYEELPAYLAGWDVALLPFARNEATRYISPTKTPEYLAAGKPVVSTSIRDVVAPYGERGLVRIADTIPDFVMAVQASLAEDRKARQRRADAFLSPLSWNATWARMKALADAACGVTADTRAA